MQYVRRDRQAQEPTEKKEIRRRVLRKHDICADLSNAHITKTVHEWIHNERNRKIIIDRLTNGITYERLAEKYDMSVRQIKNIVYKSMDIISKRL